MYLYKRGKNLIQSHSDGGERQLVRHLFLEKQVICIASDVTVHLCLRNPNYISVTLAILNSEEVKTIAGE